MAITKLAVGLGFVGLTSMLSSGCETLGRAKADDHIRGTSGSALTSRILSWDDDPELSGVTAMPTAESCTETLAAPCAKTGSSATGRAQGAPVPGIATVLPGPTVAWSSRRRIGPALKITS